MMEDDKGRTIMLTAVMRNQKETVQLLIERRADPQAKDEFGDNALDLAAKQGTMACIESLGISKGRNDKTALFLAAEHGQFGCLTEVLNARADIEAKG